MIGLTLVTVVAVLGAGVNRRHTRAVTEQVRRRLRRRRARQGVPFKAAEGDELAKVAGVEGSRTSARTPRSCTATRTTITGIDPATIGDFYRFDWTAARGARSRSSAPTARSSRRRYAEASTWPSAAACRSRRRPATSTRSSSAGSTTAPERRRCSATSASAGRRSTRRYAHPRNSLTFLDADDGCGRGDPVHGRRLRRRPRAHHGRVRQGRDQGHGDVRWRCSTCCSASRSS